MRPRNALRTMALGLPETEERETWGDITFRVRDKMFVITGQDFSTASVKSSKEEQAALIAADPVTFEVAAYVGRFGWLRVDLARVDRNELHELVTEAWRMTAPKRLVASWDAGTA